MVLKQRLSKTFRRLMSSHLRVDLYTCGSFRDQSGKIVTHKVWNRSLPLLYSDWNTSVLEVDAAVDSDCKDKHELCQIQFNALPGIVDPSLHPLSPVSKMKVKQVSCGAQFMLCLTLTGQVYSQGIGSRGQLGHGDLNDKRDLTKVIDIEMLTIVSVSTGLWHSGALTDAGDLFTWGWNEFGQLGYKSLALSDHTTSTTVDSDDPVPLSCYPRPIQLPDDDTEIVQFDCGARHSACLTSTNQLFTFGWNKMCQLGTIGSTLIESADHPIKVIDLPPPPNPNCTAFVTCGHWSTTLGWTIPAINA